jgi:serine/threonine-protein kinase
MLIPKIFRRWRAPSSPGGTVDVRPGLADDGPATRLSVGVRRPPERSACGERTRAGERAAEPATPVASGALGAADDEPAPELPAPGSLLGGSYRVGTEIAHGAMGVVLSAFDVHLRRPVAIKLVRAELLGSGHRQRLLDEARAMAQVNHPNVVRVYAFGDHLGLPFIVMERVEGTNLQQWLREFSPAAPQLALRLLQEVCGGVSAIHAVGAVHRDLKPGNILLDAGLTARVADFGACAGLDGGSTDWLGSAGDVLGTPGYMPPEALSPHAEAAPSPRSDVYALGCIAYELLTGRHPFRATGTAPASAIASRGTSIAPPSTVCPHLPRALDRPVLGALEWDIEQRPASVEAFCQGLLDGIPGRLQAQLAP